MRLDKIICLTFLSLGLAITSFAQTYRMESYNTQSGILSDHINDVAQDTDGTLWISTNKGLSTFDGIKFHNLRDSNNLFPISVNSKIKIVTSNQVIVAGLNAASHFVGRYWKDSKWNNLAFPDSLNYTSKRIWDATIVENELLVKLVFKNLLFSYSSVSKTWDSIPIPIAAHNKVSKILIRETGTILLAHTGIYKETQQGWQEVLIFDKNQQKHNATDILFDNQADSSFWLVGTDWFAKYEAGELTQIPIATTLADSKFEVLRKSNNGFLFFRSDKSFFWYHIKSKTYQSFIPLSDDIGVTNARIFPDKENGLWITSYRGLHHIASFLFSGFGKEKGFLDTEVSLINEIAPNEYIIGFKNGFGILKDDSIVYSHKTSLWNGQSAMLISAARDNNNRTYLAGHQLGVGILQQDFSVKWIPQAEANIVMVSYLKDTLWAGTGSSELYFLSKGKLIKKVFLNGYPRQLTALPNGSLLACTRSGIRIITGSSVKEINDAPNLLQKQVYCSFIENNKVYLGTEGGLAILDNGMIKKGIIQGKHIDRAIYAIIKGKEGYWFGTDNGIYLLKDSTLTHFDESSGLVGWEINRGAFIEDSKGRLVIGTNKGLNFYDPLFTESKSLYFQPIIKWIRANNKIFSTTDSIELSYNENFITIGLQAITYTGKPVEFRYRMIGYQDAWLYLSSSDVREVTYRSLPSGEFTFEFQARLSDSSWGRIVKSQTINISTPFYKSYLFLLLLLLVAGGMGYIVRWLLSNKKTRERLKLEIDRSIKELRKSETKLELALENSKMGVWMYRFDTDAAEYSREMYEILDMDPDSEYLKKGTYLAIVHEMDKRRVKTKLREALKNHTPYNMELRIILRNGDVRWIHVKGKASYKTDGSLNVFSGTMSDISERKELEADRELMISELEKTNQELDRFIYSVSHDLSAPIKSIQGLINLTRMEQLSKDSQHYLTLIEQSIKRQNQFISEIIEFGRNSRTQVQMELIDIEKLINNIIEDLKYSEYYFNNEIKVRVDPEVKLIECDQIRMKIILNNLLSNAIKFKSKFKDKHIVTVSVFKNDTRFGLTVEDNGIGIDSKHLNRLFTMFYRATDQQSGSGIGLYIAFEAAKKMNLSLKVSSVLGEGSTFTLK
jgi:PAS domain S-box-containing protein